MWDDRIDWDLSSDSGLEPIRLAHLLKQALLTRENPILSWTLGYTRATLNIKHHWKISVKSQAATCPSYLYTFAVLPSPTISREPVNHWQATKDLHSQHSPHQPHRTFLRAVLLSSKSPSANHLLALTICITLISCLASIGSVEIANRAQGTPLSSLFALMPSQSRYLVRRV